MKSYENADDPNTEFAVLLLLLAISIFVSSVSILELVPSAFAAPATSSKNRTFVRISREQHAQRTLQLLSIAYPDHALEALATAAQYMFYIAQTCQHG